MARLHTHPYPIMHVQDLKDPVVFVVDMIKGFINTGSLHDEKIADIEPNIQDVLEKLECNTIFVCDSHPPKTREFLSFPEHCLIGSEEAEIVDSLKPFIKRIIKKNSTNTFVAPEFEDFLKEDLSYYKDIVVTGCCTDLCVLQFVLSFNAWLNEHNMHEYRIIVVENCVETYDIAQVHDACFWNDVALKMMVSNGIIVVSEIKE